jgi:hypothetical protein
LFDFDIANVLQKNFIKNFFIKKVIYIFAEIKTNYMKITTETKEQIYITEFKNSDVSLEQLFDAFKSHLVALTFNEITIEHYIIIWSNELKEKNNETN